jgi:hypothetical protein
VDHPDCLAQSLILTVCEPEVHHMKMFYLQVLSESSRPKIMSVRLSPSSFSIKKSADSQKCSSTWLTAFSSFLTYEKLAVRSWHTHWQHGTAILRKTGVIARLTWKLPGSATWQWYSSLSCTCKLQNKEKVLLLRQSLNFKLSVNASITLTSIGIVIFSGQK